MPQHRPLSLGTATAVAGEITHGWYTLAELATGHVERLPVTLARGREPGPTAWLSANIHGDEVTGLAVLHDLVTPALLADLRGTVVALPSLSPAGLHTRSRLSFLEGRDPNRLFPGLDPPGARPEVPGALEIGYAALFAELRASADLYVDLHCYGLQAATFIIRDRILYRDEAERPALVALDERLDALCRASGLPVVHELPAAHYVERRLHRSTSGAALNLARIPAITVELGLIGGIDPDALAAGTLGVRNILKGSGMLPGAPEPITSVPQPAIDFPVTRDSTLRARTSGVIRYHVRPGDVFRAGDLLATLTDLHGRPLASDGEIRAAADGWVLALARGGVCFQGQAVTHVAVRDPGPMLERFPVGPDAG
jgi:uncharacterized protein